MSQARGVLVNIDVPHLASAIRFYERALGWRLCRRLFDGQVAEMQAGALHIYLLERAADARSPVPARARDYGRHWTPVHLDLVVDDLEDALARAEANGARLEGRIHEQPYGRLASLADPFGHGFCLIQFNAQGYDAVATPTRSDSP